MLFTFHIQDFNKLRNVNLLSGMLFTFHMQDFNKLRNVNLLLFSCLLNLAVYFLFLRLKLAFSSQLFIKFIINLLIDLLLYP